ncbi:Membrane cofactor protein, partial [Lemmus lemmus]
VQYTCLRNYRLIGEKTIFCKSKDQVKAAWDKTPPVCEKIFCPPPPPVLNGRHTGSFSENVPYGSTVTYTCDPSPGKKLFNLVGEPSLHCTSNDGEVGVWSGPPPQCTVVKCPFPLLQNGRQIEGFAKKFSYEAKVTFECAEGFYMKGKDTVVCSANSTWEPPIPICIKGNTDNRN